MYASLMFSHNLVLSGQSRWLKTVVRGQARTLAVCQFNQMYYASWNSGSMPVQLILRGMLAGKVAVCKFQATDLHDFLV